jgi:hypothetical protein
LTEGDKLAVLTMKPFHATRLETNPDTVRVAVDSSGKEDGMRSFLPVYWLAASMVLLHSTVSSVYYILEKSVIIS